MQKYSIEVVLFGALVSSSMALAQGERSINTVVGTELNLTDSTSAQLPTSAELEMRLRASTHAPTAHARYLQGLRDQEQLQQLQAQAESELELLQSQLAAAQAAAQLNQLTNQANSDGAEPSPLSDLELIQASRHKHGWRVTLLWQQRELIFNSTRPSMHGINVRWDESGVHAQMKGAQRSWLL